MFGVLRPGSPEAERLPISPATSPPPPKSMAPLPPGQYDSREELLAHAKDWAADQGYAIVIARSRFNRLWLKCDRGGKYENRRNLTPDQRKRKRSDSRLLGCPFRILAVVRKDGIWKVHVEVAEHNHGPSEDLTQHPTLRRLTEDQSQKVNEMMDAGNTPAETIEELRRLWPTIKLLTRDVYNARKKYKTQKDLAEQASGLHPEPLYEDPNGTFPGPTPNGRWEWVPDGEEVTSKNKKRKRKPPTQQQSLDPQLHTPSTSQFPHQYPPNTVDHDSIQSFQSTHSMPQQRNTLRLDNRRPATTTLQNSHPFTNLDEPQDFPPDDPSLFPNQPYIHSNAASRSPPQQQSHTRTAETASMLSSSSYPGTTIHGQHQNAHFNNTPKAQSGQVIMSRIERMEKEQRDQKDMLQQILASVQNMQGVAR